MSTKYPELHKIIRKGKKVSSGAVNLYDSLVKQISHSYNEDIARELDFLTLYYGLQGKSMTLESIGQAQSSPLTRERVRQIIDSVLDEVNIEGDDNPYMLAKQHFEHLLAIKQTVENDMDKQFIRLDELLSDSFFISFKKNVKGLISFLNDCGIRQIAYRKKYYFYLKINDRKSVVADIQKENKVLRREKTLEKMSQKAKTVTYVPDEVRQHLLLWAQKNDLNLNPLYENILSDFMNTRPYLNEHYVFSRTKSWKARKGKAQWQQIGIYIERHIFDAIKENVKSIRKELGKNVSLMSFICQSFVWHYEKNSLKSDI